MNKRKLLEKARNSPNNLHFEDFVALVEAFGFRLDRISGDHHIYLKQMTSGRIRLNLQPHRGNAKAYQVRQFLAAVDEHGLELED